MSAPTNTDKSPTISGPESPTTARPLEMDDDDVQETGVLTVEGETQAPKSTTVPASDPNATTSATPGAAAESDEAPPPKPPRPMTEQQKNEQILKEAFPGIDAKVIKAVLSASFGRIEPAFNALLEMTDPEAAKNNELPPPPPPRPTQAPVPVGSTPQSQLEADEQYARQLAQQFESVGSYEARTSSRGVRSSDGNSDERERNFIDDELPAIRENLRKGFVETQSKVNTWFTNFKKRIDDQFDENGEGGEASQQQAAGAGAGPGASAPRWGRRSGDGRPSGDYDADPQVLSGDFAGMKFHNDGTPVYDPRSGDNPHLFRPPPPSKSPRPGDRKVAFQEGTEEINAYDASPKVPPKDNPGAKASKWQPLSTIDPSPIAENDPFSLGDSEDEREAKDKSGAKEIKMEDSERLRQAAAEAMADSLVEDKSAAAAAAAEAKKD